MTTIRFAQHRACVVWTLLLLAGLTAKDANAAAPKRRVRVVRGAEASAPVAASGEFVGDLRALPTAPQWQPGDPMKPVNPLRERPPLVDRSNEPQPSAIDPLLAQQADADRSAAPSVIGSPLVNVAGLPFSGVFPPDTVGEVGANYFVQAINHGSGTQFRVHNKTTGAVVSGPTILDALWTAGGACANGFGDPIVAWDGLASRWILMEFAGTGNHLCVYVSKGPDLVTSGFWLYNFTTPQFPDYPKLAVWPDAYYVGANEGTPGPAAYAFDRARMLQGQPATFQRFTTSTLAGFSFEGLAPSDLDGPTSPPAGAPAWFLRHYDVQAHGGAGADRLELFAFHVDWTTPANSTFTGPIGVNLAAFDSSLCGLSTFMCIPQQGGSLLDPLREVVMHAVRYRNFGSYETILGNFSVDADGTDHAGLRWFELRRTGAGAWTLQQQGTFAPDANHRWMGSAAVDRKGNVALGYSISATNMFPSIRYTGRLASDTPGTLPQGEITLQAGTAAQASVDRWGDYSTLSLDPRDGCTFWYTTEYGEAPNWATRIGAFRFPGCKTHPIVDFDGNSASDVVIYRGGAWLSFTAP